MPHEIAAAVGGSIKKQAAHALVYKVAIIGFLYDIKVFCRASLKRLNSVFFCFIVVLRTLCSAAPKR